VRAGRLAPFALAFLLLVPAVVAQAPAEPRVQMTAGTFPNRVAPELSATTTVGLRFSCSQDELKREPGSDILVELATGPVPAFVNFTLHPGQAHVSPADVAHCTDDSIQHHVNATVNLVLARSAPAFEPRTIPVLARIAFAALDGSDVRRGPYATNLTFTPDYFPSFQVDVDAFSKRASGPGRNASFEVHLTNRANGASLVAFTATDAAGLNLTFPPPVTLKFATEPVVVRLVAAVPDALYRPSLSHTFRVKVLLSSEDRRANQTSEVELVLTVQDPPSSRGAPGLGTALALCILVWVVLRRRRPT